jgi:hypothetical protein
VRIKAAASANAVSLLLLLLLLLLVAAAGMCGAALIPIPVRLAHAFNVTGNNVTGNFLTPRK